MKVVIVGGGIAGISAAHMLSSNKNVDIHVYESEDMIGGQACSKMGKLCFIEYCWRMFFSTYDNLNSIIHELKVEPNFDTARTCTYDKNQDKTTTVIDFILTMIKEGNWSVLNKMVNTICECKPRLITEYDISADEYFEHHNYIRTLIGPIFGLDATKVSMSGFMKFLYSMYNTQYTREHTVAGLPTYQALFEPWQAYLEKKGVHFHVSSPCTEIHYTDKINNVVIRGEPIIADEYIFCCSLKPLNRLLQPTCTTFKHLKFLESGLQLYYSISIHFSKETPPDHCNQFVLMDTPWLLLADKKRAWKKKVLVHCNPNVKESWNIAAMDGIKGSLYHKILSECSKEEAQAEILYQLEQSDYFKKMNMDILEVEDWYQFENNEEGKLISTNPKFSVNVGNLKRMPTSHPKDIPKNMWLAGYYCKSTMGGTSMESSCETGLQAAQDLLDSKKMIHTYQVKEHTNWFFTYYTIPLVWFDYVLYYLKIRPLTHVIPSILLVVVYTLCLLYLIIYVVTKRK